MNKKISLGAALALMLVISAVTFTVTMLFSEQMFSRTVHNISEREAMYDKLSEIDKFVRDNYYGVIQEDALMDAIATGYMGSLGDPYAAYHPAEEFSVSQLQSEGRLVGIGIAISKNESGFIQVDEVYPDSPAQQAGIQVGELIVKVNETDVTSENYEEAVGQISGSAGTKLSLVIRNGTEDRTIPEITRRAVQRPTVYSDQFGEAGYIKITDFNDNTYDQFKKAVEDLVGGKGAKALIFDVRNNVGGSMTSVTKILDMLLPEGDLLTATYKNGRTEVIATSDASCIELPMVVITNGKTASAAELFTQALRDYGVAKSVGETTYGKGVMQVTQTLKDGSAITLTIAQYNPPKSPNFDGVGLKPDYEVILTEDQNKIIGLLDENSDPQIQKALELTKVDSTPIPLPPSTSVPQEDRDGEENLPEDGENYQDDTGEEGQTEDQAGTGEEEQTEDETGDNEEGQEDSGY